MVETRLDYYEGLPWKKGEDGRYWVHLTLGKVGKGLKYYARGDRGELIERIEVASEEGLFNDESVSSLKGLPVLLRHPKSGKFGLNQDGLKVGNILSTIGREDGNLIAECVIDDRRGVELIDKILKQGGIPEASSGYHLKELRRLDDGTFEQIRSTYDHVAAPLLPGRGRGGQDLALRFDAVSDRELFFLGEKKSMGNIVVRLDEQDIVITDPSPEVERAIAGLQSKLKTALDDLEGIEERMDEMENELKELESERADAQSRLDSIDIGAESKMRLDLWEQVRAIAPNAAIDYALSPTDIKKLGIKAVDAEINLDGLSDEIIDGIWRGVNMRKPPAPGSRTDEYLAQAGNGSGPVDEYEAIAASYENAHKKGR